MKNFLVATWHETHGTQHLENGNFGFDVVRRQTLRDGVDTRRVG